VLRTLSTLSILILSHW